MSEPFKVSAARNKRASKLSDAVREWEKLAAQNRYPRSLHDILRSALEHEYQLGKKRRTGSRSSAAEHGRKTT